jgi:secondary thiamine-phosphate synthase enzyme
METIDIRSTSHTELIDITDRVQDAVERLNVSDGLCCAYVPHTTAGLTINESADPSVRQDILMALNRIVPGELPYRHGEGNSPAHIKASLIGSSATVFVESGRLVLGTWQGIFFCEFDGPRTRRLYIKGLKERP